MFELIMVLINNAYYFQQGKNVKENLKMKGA